MATNWKDVHAEAIADGQLSEGRIGERGVGIGLPPASWSIVA